MRRFDKKKNMEQANMLLEQRRLIEMGLLPEIEHSHQEARQMEDKYNEILNAKAISISAKYFDKDILLAPKVRVWMGNDGLNTENLSYNLQFRREHSGYSPEEVSVTIHGGGAQMSAWKESSISLEDSEISKIFRMVNDASDYIGGVDMDKLSQELMRKLKPNKNRQGLEEIDYDEANDTYFETLSEALDEVRRKASTIGCTLDEDELFTQFGTGGVSYGTTKSATIPLLKDGEPILSKSGKPLNRALRVVIYRMGSGNYELTVYKTW